MLLLLLLTGTPFFVSPAARTNLANMTSTSVVLFNNYSLSNSDVSI